MYLRSSRLIRPFIKAKNHYSTSRSVYSKSWTQYSKAASISALTLASLYGWQSPFTTDASRESTDAIEHSISIDKTVPSFPLEIAEPLTSEFQLVGHGTRSVTFLNFRVYALGIYVAKDDVARVRQILDSKFMSSFYSKDSSMTHPEQLSHALKDPEISTVLIDNLLSAGVKFAVRITPVRNTDFNHLRDGLIKSILASDRAKKMQQSNDSAVLGNGLDQLRAAFGKRGSVPKGDSLLIETGPASELLLSYQSFDKGGQLKQSFELGKVAEPVVSNLLFLQYLSGKKPLSENTRDSAADGLASLC